VFFLAEYQLSPNKINSTHQTHTKQNTTREKCENICDELLAEMTPESQQLIKGAMEKGASCWLSALPIKAIGYALNKQ